MIGEKCPNCGKLVEVTPAQYKKINSGKQVEKQCKECKEKFTLELNLIAN
jgi:hypothetical protein